MSSQLLKGKKFAILVADGFEQVEMTEPRRALVDAGATFDLISPRSGTVQGVHHDKKGDAFDVTVALDMADPHDYDGLVLPGGLQNPDTLRQNRKAIEFVRAIAQTGKPIAAICHGPWTLIEAGLVEGRTLTSYPSIKTDLRNAGAKWVDQEVVVDRNMITSRQPADLPAFCSRMVEEFAQGSRSASHMGANQPDVGYFAQWE